MAAPVVKPMIDIPHIAVLVQSMVRKALDAFVNRDEYGAQRSRMDTLSTVCALPAITS